jgi:hypothetical protein
MKITSTRKAILYLAAVFIAGLVIGGLCGFTAGFIYKFKLPSGPEWEAKVFGDLKGKLKLRPDQESETKAAVHDMAEDLLGAFKDLAKTGTNAVVKCQRRLEPILDDSQRVALSNIVNGNFQKANSEMSKDAQK